MRALDSLLAEPDDNLPVSGSRGVRGMDGIVGELLAEAPPDGVGLGVLWIRGAIDRPDLFNGIFSADHHGHDGAGQDGFDESLVEGFLRMFPVMFLGLPGQSLYHFKLFDDEPFCLIGRDDLSDEISFYPIGLDQDQTSFHRSIPP